MVFYTFQRDLISTGKLGRGINYITQRGQGICIKLNAKIDSHKHSPDFWDVDQASPPKMYGPMGREKEGW